MHLDLIKIRKLGPFYTYHDDVFKITLFLTVVIFPDILLQKRYMWTFGYLYICSVNENTTDQSLNIMHFGPWYPDFSSVNAKRSFSQLNQIRLCLLSFYDRT